MGRPRINRELPKYASEFRDRHGKARVRFRRTGWRTTYSTARVGSVEFTQEYKTWEAFGQLVVGEKKVVPGTFDDLIIRFYASQRWREIAPATQEQYRGQLERFRAKHGHRPVATVEARHFQRIFDAMWQTPVAANNLRKRMMQLMNFAVRENFRKSNPIPATENLKVAKGGFPTWTEEEIARFEAFHPVGSTARIAFDLALYTAQRRADVLLMGPSSIERGKIKLRQQKTGAELVIPIHPCLGVSLRSVPTNQETYIVNSWGKPFSNDSFGMWFKRRCVEAGVPDKSMHGLRKAAARRLAEIGLSNQMIKSVTGHTSDSEVARYTAAADQERMADAAIKSLDLANPA